LQFVHFGPVFRRTQTCKSPLTPEKVTKMSVFDIFVSSKSQCRFGNCSDFPCYMRFSQKLLCPKGVARKLLMDLVAMCRLGNMAEGEGESRLSGGAYRVAFDNQGPRRAQGKKRRREPGGKGLVTSRNAAPWDIPRVGEGRQALRFEPAHLPIPRGVETRQCRCLDLVEAK
jgi:hypothetical protein